MKNIKKSGTSLIELVLYMGLLSILMIILTQTFGSIMQARLDSEATSSVQQNAK